MLSSSIFNNISDKVFFSLAVKGAFGFLRGLACVFEATFTKRMAVIHRSPKI